MPPSESISSAVSPDNSVMTTGLGTPNLSNFGRRNLDVPPLATGENPRDAEACRHGNKEQK